MTDTAEHQQSSWADDGVEQVPSSPPRPSFWRRLWPTAADLQARHADALMELDDAIALHPDAAVNYALRGELYLKCKNPALAADDFERALSLVAQSMENSPWGLLDQAMQDRARRGLKQAAQRLKNQTGQSLADNS
jgi:tetratricopeptide (TPR) repeat protein